MKSNTNNDIKFDARTETKVNKYEFTVAIEFVYDVTLCIDIKVNAISGVFQKFMDTVLYNI